jgi:hypothetical protein
MSGLGAPNCSRTYFCHRIPPLRFEFPHRAICARGGLKKAGMTETAAHLGANCALPRTGMRKTPRHLRGSIARSQNQFPSYLLPDITGVGTRTNQRDPTALKATCQGYVWRM